MPQRCQFRKSPQSFDHVVGKGEQCWRHLKAQRFRGLEIDHQLKLGGLLHRQFGRVSAPQNLIHIDRGFSGQLHKIETIRTR
jgi:hypothetical protein